MRWDGTAWAREESGTDEDLYAVACAQDEVVAVGGNLHIGGDSLILHRAEHGWVAEPSGMQHILLAVAHGGLGWMAAGFNGGILRGQPGEWSRVDVVHYSHVFALLVGRARAFAAGLNGTLIELDGASWHPHETGSDAHLRGLAAFPEGDLLAVGLQGTILRHDGTRWKTIESPTEAALEGVWIASESEAYAVGYAGTVLRFDGLRWNQLDVAVRQNLHSVHGNEEQVIAVGGRGVVLCIAR